MRYWDLTPEDMAYQIHGHAMRRARAWYLAAWQTSYLLSGLVGKKAPSPEKLVGAETMALIRPRDRMPMPEEDE